MTTPNRPAFGHDAGLRHNGRLPMHSLRRTPGTDLDGPWDFQLLDTPDAAATDTWRTVDVPSLWTMQEDSDRPHYTNVAMPFPEVPPQIPADNPTGLYRRVVEVPQTPGRRTVLHVGAAAGLLRVYVNGRQVGVSSDSHLAAEFDVTDYLDEGANTFELRVSKWSAATYLEDQDQWWQSGLSRSVFLYSVPQVRLADVSAVTDWDPATGLGSLRATISTSGLEHLDGNDWQVRITTLGHVHSTPVLARIPAQTPPVLPQDRSVRTEPLFPMEDTMDLMSEVAVGMPLPALAQAIGDAGAEFMRPPQPAGNAVFTLDGLDVPPWTAETPHLEDLLVQLLSPAGEVVDETSTRVGYRRVRIEGRDLLVNGRRILIQGVNRHDVDMRTGRVMSRETMLAELSLLKKFNVNAVRTAHYPNDPVFLDLCDEFGFYVVDEADIEGHAFLTALPGDPRYLPEFVERVSRMVLRDRNHPSVIIWSLGNETGYGPNHDAAAAWVRATDPTRPLHYEGAITTDWHAGHGATDILCPMYPSFASLEAYSADPRGDRPLIMCEYAYTQGNSTGGLADYWALIETLPGLQGGFIWEFKDHALDPDGDGRYRYGGDFGDQPNDGATLLNGLVFPDLTPKPALFEARGLFSPLRISASTEELRSGTVTLRNRQTFADISGYTLELRVETDNGPHAPVTVPTPVLPAGQQTTVDIPAALRDQLADDTALALTVTVRTRHLTPWAQAGTEIAVEQVSLPRTPKPVAVSRRGTAHAPSDGVLAHPLLRQAPQLSLWRALTDNDNAFSLDNRFLRTGFFDLSTVDVQLDKSGDDLVVTTCYQAAFGDQVLHRRTITALDDADWVLKESVELPEVGEALRVGMRFELADGFDQVRWTGLGPWENYPDRRASALLGTWQSSIDDLAVPYLLPQESGVRGEVTTLEISGPAGTVRTRHTTPLHMNVSRYSTAELEAATHWWKLPSSTTAIVHLDIAHRGAGTGALGPDVRPEHRLTDRRYDWQWRLTVAH
ncbi:glycoside hydrolase family 2 TIM barrel-domain containing protein [Streptomyces caniscabiei]|uniref:glycoside hydrolase family 2 TIM barrel-domain containing protein n=1 Tax=Streptomyces caniscabiei TaxID=2746961 RepID=UPI000A584C82|nr:glycoside hydrolase family 2 TIM barrel-domain containing protein [Streptomyces caniscabiei]